MEDVLDVYQKTYDPLRPQLCFDERPCFLIGDVLVPVPCKPGQPGRHHYEYQKHGSCYVLLAFERHTGFRYVEVCHNRTMHDYARFMNNLVQKHYSHVEKIVLVQDNLNTHDPGSFYETFDAETSFSLAQMFETHYTPIKGSWLNMAEIEFAALSKQCLDRRIGNFDALEHEVLAWARQRNIDRSTVNWQFNASSARQKFSSKYQKSNN